MEHDTNTGEQTDGAARIRIDDPASGAVAPQLFLRERTYD